MISSLKTTRFVIQFSPHQECSAEKFDKSLTKLLLIASALPTSFPGSSLFLPRESTLVSAGHVAPKIWVLTRMCYRGWVAKCKIVTSVRMVESTGGDVSFFRNICGDKNSFYRQVFLHYIRTFDIEAVLGIFDSEKHVYYAIAKQIYNKESRRPYASRSSK